MKLPVYLGLLHRAETTLAQSFRQVSDGHRDEPDVRFLCRSLADQCDAHTLALRPIIARYGEGNPGDEPERLHADGLSQTRSGGLGLLRDLQDLYFLGSFVDITWTMVKQAAQGLRDAELLEVVASGSIARRAASSRSRRQVLDHRRAPPGRPVLATRGSRWSRRSTARSRSPRCRLCSICSGALRSCTAPRDRGVRRQDRADLPDLSSNASVTVPYRSNVLIPTIGAHIISAFPGSGAGDNRP